MGLVLSFKKAEVFVIGWLLSHLPIPVLEDHMSYVRYKKFLINNTQTLLQLRKLPAYFLLVSHHEENGQRQ